jgi:hypothetical protein
MEIIDRLPFADGARRITVGGTQTPINAAMTVEGAGSG